MSVINTVKTVAAFADQNTKPELDHVGFGYVVFHKGEVWAGNVAGGALQKVDLPLDGAIPAKALIRALKACRGEAEFHQDGQELLLTGEGGSKVVLPMRKLDTLPRMTRPAKKAKWLVVVGLDQASRVSWAVSNDESRRHLGGIYIDHRGLTTTNGHALAHLELDTGLEEKAEGLLIQAAQLKGLAEKIWLHSADGTVYLAADSAKSGFRTARLIQREFPPYAAILDQRPDAGFRVSREDLLDLVKRARLSYHVGELQLEGQELSVVLENEPMESLFSFRGGVPVEAIKGRQMPQGRIGLDLALLQSCLDAVEGDSVECSMTLTPKGSLDPAFFEGGRFTGVVMPCRL